MLYACILKYTKKNALLVLIMMCIIWHHIYIVQIECKWAMKNFKNAEFITQKNRASIRISSRFYHLIENSFIFPV